MDKPRIMTSSEKLKDIQHDTKDIQTTLDAINNTLGAFGESLNRIFRLYEQHEVDINKMIVYMAEHKIIEDQLKDVDRETIDAIKNFNDTRQPILDRLTALEETKADKADMNKVFLQLQHVNDKLDDLKEAEDKKDVQHTLSLTRRDAYIIAVMGIIGGLVGTIIYVLAFAKPG